MPNEPNETTVPNPAPRASRNERTEAKFLEDAEKIIVEAERLGADYQPPNQPAKVVNLKAKRDATLTARTAHQANEALEEQARNQRENLFKPLNGDVTRLVGYAKAAGKADNEIAALQAIARDIRGGRAKPLDPNDNTPNISVANLSYATRADNYAQFIEQYDALGIETEEDFYKTATHRAKQTALAAANNAVITAQADSNTTGETLDQLAYTDADSLLNACISEKAYLKSKYKTTGQPYKNIAKTRFVLPSRLRDK
jgi:hypothetical protein